MQVLRHLAFATQADLDLSSDLLGFTPNPSGLFGLEYILFASLRSCSLPNCLKIAVFTLAVSQASFSRWAPSFLNLGTWPILIVLYSRLHSNLFVPEHSPFPRFARPRANLVVASEGFCMECTVIDCRREMGLVVVDRACFMVCRSICRWTTNPWEDLTLWFFLWAGDESLFVAFWVCDTTERGHYWVE